MKSATLRILVLIACTLLAGLTLGCKKPVAVAKETKDAHGSAAQAFCAQVVQCEKEEMHRRLADDVQRRTYLDGRMTDAACVDERLHSIEADANVASALPLCSEVLASANSCEAKLQLLRSDEHCKATLRL